jgi:hypothetical protein
VSGRRLVTGSLDWRYVAGKIERGILYLFSVGAVEEDHG